MAVCEHGGVRAWWCVSMAVCEHGSVSVIVDQYGFTHLVPAGPVR